MRRLWWLLLLYPFVDLYLVVKLAGAIGVDWLFVFIVISGIAGASVARTEVLKLSGKLRQAAAAPEEGILREVLVVIGGILLVLPGVITDVLGLALLIPPLRNLIAGKIRHRLEVRRQGYRVEVSGAPPPEAFKPKQMREDVIDAEWEEEKKKPAPE